MRAIFFDLDETLCDTNGSRGQRAALASQRLVQDYPHLNVAALACRMLEVDGATGWPRGVSLLLQELGLEDCDAGREARGLWFFEGCSELLTLWPGETELLRRLSRDYVFGVITNGPDSIQRAKFGYLGVEDCFRVFVSSERAGVYKPDPAIFRLALEEAGVQAHEAIFVGDLLSVDVAGAKAAGLRSVWLNHEGAALRPDDPQPDAVISRFEGLPSALEKLGFTVAK